MMIVEKTLSTFMTLKDLNIKKFKNGNNIIKIKKCQNNSTIWSKKSCNNDSSQDRSATRPGTQGLYICLGLDLDLDLDSTWVTTTPRTPKTQ